MSAAVDACARSPSGLQLCERLSWSVTYGAWLPLGAAACGVQHVGGVDTADEVRGAPVLELEPEDVEAVDGVIRIAAQSVGLPGYSGDA